MIASFLLASALLQQPDPFVGEWRGMSVCQVRPSPCHDEQSVYRVVRTGSGGAYRILMSKMVGGQEEQFGQLDGRFANGRFTAVTHDRQGRAGTWTFTLNGNHLSGRLDQQGAGLYRLIELDRTTSP